MATSRAAQTPSDRPRQAIEPAPEAPGAVGQMADEECHLLNLPVELQKTILEYLTTNEDKKSACLTCKQMQLLVTPLIYRHMELSGDDLLDDDFRFSLTRHQYHHGLKHVRTLRIVDLDDCHLRGFCGSIAVICHLLNTIPNHSLTGFEMPVGGLKSADIDHTIRVKQRDITNYQYRSLECSGPGMWRGLALDTDYLARITTLQLSLSTQEECKHAIIWLDSTPNLASLDLSLFGDISWGFDEPFAFMKPVLGPRMLKSLRLEHVSFSNGTTKLAQFVRLDKLEELHLVSCDSTCFLLRDLKRQPLCLKTFIVVEDEGRDPCLSYNDFVRYLDSSERISLWLCPEMDGSGVMFDWSALQAHASAIKYLRVEYGEVMPALPTQKSESDFARFCRSAVNLEQLSMSWIDIDPDSHEGPSLLPIVYFLDCAAALRSLKTLKLEVRYNEPCDFSDHRLLEVRRGVPQARSRLDERAGRRQRLIKTTIKNIFALLGFGCPDLTAVVIAMRGREAEDNEVHSFLRSKQIVHGHWTSLVTPVDHHMVKYHEPCSEILEQDKLGIGMAAG